MRRHRQPRRGDGTAWLIADRIKGDYVCYWYTGAEDDHLVGHERAASAEAAVAWGRQRTARVRIRTADGRTAWAGIGPAPGAFAYTWTEPIGANVEPPRPSRAASSSPGSADRSTAKPTLPGTVQIRLPEVRPLMGAIQAPTGAVPC